MDLSDGLDVDGSMPLGRGQALVLCSSQTLHEAAAELGPLALPEGQRFLLLLRAPGPPSAPRPRVRVSGSEEALEVVGASGWDDAGNPAVALLALPPAPTGPGGGMALEVEWEDEIVARDLPRVWVREMAGASTEGVA